MQSECLISTSSDAKWKSVPWSGENTFQIVFGHVTCTFVKAPLIVKGRYRFGINIRCHPDDDFFRDIPAFSRKTMPSNILHVTTA